MNRVNRSLFSKLKQQYELKKMMAAYIGAEQQIIASSSNGMADGMELLLLNTIHLVTNLPSLK